MTAKQRYSAFGPLPAHPLEAELMYCDGNITAYPAKEQVIPTGARERAAMLQVEKLNQMESKRMSSG